jgi:hypothetical protein
LRNPLRSEADAFRFVCLTIGYFALIVIGSLISSWVGLAVFIVLTVGVLWSILRSGRPQLPVRQAPAESPLGEHRILVVANETVGGAELLEEIRSRSTGPQARVLVVCPALNSPLKHWASDEAPQRRRGSTRAWRRCEPRASTPRARSATATRSRRSRMRCARSAPTS